jgi:hypothetical protein
VQNLLISFNNNVLKVTTAGKNGLEYTSRDLDDGVINGPVIVDPVRFAEILKVLIPDITKTSFKHLSLNFMEGSPHTYLRFVTLAKNNVDTSSEASVTAEDRILHEVQSKLDEVKLEDLYFSYEKIAPFVYQFVGVRKDILELYMEVANATGISLGAVVPWVSLLPKYLNLNDPAIFIINQEGDYVVALSELNGIFFTEVFQNVKDIKGFEQLVQQLSVYKRSEPIKKIYTLDCAGIELSLADGGSIEEIEAPREELNGAESYGLNLIANYMIDTHYGFSDGQLNLLNLLPVPAKVASRSPAVVYAGSIAGLVVLASGMLFFFPQLRGKVGQVFSRGSGGDIAGASEVLESTGSQEDIGDVVVATSLGDANGEAAPDSQEDTSTAEDLNRKELIAMVENGAGIPGIAGRTRDRLEDLGYVVTDVGNADEVGAPETILRFKKDFVGYADMLKEDMVEIYLDIVVEDTLDTTEAYDVLVIVGTDVDE